MIKILVADDHDLVRMGIVRMLSDVAGFEVVGEANSGEEACRLVKEVSPDVVLMDVKMPGMGGLEATRKIASTYNQTKVIVVTACTDEAFPELLMKAGASGYVTKGAEFQEMIDAINTASRDELYMSPGVARQLALRSVGTGNMGSSPFGCLSERELQTAIMIASGSKVQAIADAFCVSPKTVNSYRYRIFEKFDLQNDVELTHLVIKHKLLDLDEIS